jgi:TRAP-type C4-dicarboxylate transport system permease small subunit
MQEFLRGKKMKKLVTTLERVLYPVTKVIDKVSWVVLFLLMLMTITQVFLRKLSNHSLLGTVELTELSMVFIVFCALAECQVHEGHIKVDLVLSRLSQRIQSLIDIFTQFACFVIFTFMTWALFAQATVTKEAGEITVDLGLPLYPFIIVAALGCFLLGLVLLIKSLKALSNFLSEETS